MTKPLKDSITAVVDILRDTVWVVAAEAAAVSSAQEPSRTGRREP